MTGVDFAGPLYCKKNPTDQDSDENYMTEDVNHKLYKGHFMVILFFLSRYPADFHEKNIVCFQCWLYNTVKISDFLHQWLSVNSCSKFAFFCGSVVRNLHKNADKTATD